MIAKHFLDHVYLRHLSAECRPSVGRHVIQAGRLSVATIGQHWVGMSVNTWPTARPLHYDQQSAAYRWTVGGTCVLLTVVFAEMEAIS